MHIQSIGAGIYTELAYSNNATSFASSDIDTAFDSPTIAKMDTLLGTISSTSFVDVENVREFPAVGAPANIVNVPNFGQKQSSQVQGQADAPTLEFTMNYVPADTATLEALVADGITRLFRMRLSNAELPSTVAASTEHDDFYWVGQIAAFNVTPSLTDSNQATLTLTVVGDFSPALTTV